VPGPSTHWFSPPTSIG